MGYDPDEMDVSPIREKALLLEDTLKKATSFRHFDLILARKTLWLRPKGRGAVLTDGHYTMKLSNASKEFSEVKLGLTYGEIFIHYISQRDRDTDDAEIIPFTSGKYQDLKSHVNLSELQVYLGHLRYQYLMNVPSLNDQELLASIAELRHKMRNKVIKTLQKKGLI